MSNLIKHRQADGANCAVLSLERFVIPTTRHVGGPQLPVMGRAERAVVGPVGETIGLNGAENAIQAANAEADGILNDARARASQILKEAREQGFNRGKEEGVREAKEGALNAAKADVASAVTALLSAASELMTVREKALADNDTEMLGLVLGVVRLVLSREIKTDKSLILQQIRRAAKILGEADEITVKLHPLDLKVAQKNMDDLVPEGKSMKLSMVADKSVEMGGCLLECNRGTVDARISTQLERIEAAFEEVLKTENEALETAPAEQQPQESPSLAVEEGEDA
ncbi:MAG: hypothetical protein JW759_08640 [Candidatus Coatesbacteria bacterium]|nr:hypothetical protein [Candidatus Coatesbacteria bacterium]